MILGMSTSTFTLLHVLISLAGIGSGLILVQGMLSGKRLDGDFSDDHGADPRHGVHVSV